ncbi:MAG: HAD family hydrolase [Rhodoferax sp.]|nr:HAD family hydrolase [Rhodoferax sp.]
MSASAIGRGVTLALFDLDHTLLSGDSDVLWCDFLMAQGLLDEADFGLRNAAMDAAYRAGTVAPLDYANFYVGTLAGREPQAWEPVRQRFLDQEIAPRIPAAARELVRDHQSEGATVVLTTATNRYLTELTALHLGVAHLIATEPEVEQGRFTGRIRGVPNMRAGKVERLNAWLAEQGRTLATYRSAAYSDSINDLPLLQATDHPVAVDPDPRLRQEAQARGWRILELVR